MQKSIPMDAFLMTHLIIANNIFILYKIHKLIADIFRCSAFDSGFVDDDNLVIGLIQKEKL